MSKEKDPTYSVDFFARLFGLTSRRVQQLASDGVIPKASRGQYPLLATVRGYVSFLQERANGARKQDGWRDERARLAREQADKIALDNDRERNSLVYVDQVADVLSRAFVSLSGDLDGLAGRAATSLSAIDDPAEIRAYLLDETRRVRRSLSSSLSGIAESLDGSEEDRGDRESSSGEVGE